MGKLPSHDSAHCSCTFSRRSPSKRGSVDPPCVRREQCDSSKLGSSTQSHVLFPTFASIPLLSFRPSAVSIFSGNPHSTHHPPSALAPCCGYDFQSALPLALAGLSPSSASSAGRCSSSLRLVSGPQASLRSFNERAISSRFHKTLKS